MRVTRVTLFFISLVIGAGFYGLTDYLLRDLESQTMQATEEAMIDSAQLLANFIENGGELEKIFQGAGNRKFQAEIHTFTKDEIGLDAYLTNKEGVVIFHSKDAQMVGEDFSDWIDVSRTLRGIYGARSTRTVETQPQSSILHVGAPIQKDGRITGCITVFKPQSDVLSFVQKRRQKIIASAALIGLGILLLIASIFIWLFRPIGRLTTYTRSITEGKRLAEPSLGSGREVKTLAKAFREMREALEGRQYAERYIQTLTHELKSPLAAIQGAAELLEEDMPASERARFTQNIRSQTQRCQELIHQLLGLSVLEIQDTLEHRHLFDLSACCRDSCGDLEALAQTSQVRLTCQVPGELPYQGDEGLIRSSLNHLLQNAIQFSSQQGEVVLSACETETAIVITITDEGPGIPDFAAERAFERFYSYRPSSPSQKLAKGNGLGLAFVKEVIELHHGEITITRKTQGGTQVIATLPIQFSQE